MQNILHVDGHVFPGIRQLKVGRPGHPRIDRRIRAVVEHLHANLCMRISVPDLARSVNMSRWHFCHLFKAEMSQSRSALPEPSCLQPDTGGIYAKCFAG